MNTIFTYIKSPRKYICLWIWRNLAAGNEPFYQNICLHDFKAPISPSPEAWHGWKLWIWNQAADYLISINELTYTPTLRQKF